MRTERWTIKSIKKKAKSRVRTYPGTYRYLVPGSSRDTWYSDMFEGRHSASPQRKARHRTALPC